MLDVRQEPTDAATLWESFHGELRAFVLSRVKSVATAEDILQSAFLRAHESLARGDAPRQPRAWLYQVVRNLVVDSHRSEARDEAIAHAVANETDDVQEPEESPDDEAFVLVARALPRFLQCLDRPQREALQMTEIEGLTQAEAASRAGISLSGMKSRVQRGRKRVFEALQRCCEFEVDGRGRMIACKRRGTDEPCCTPSTACD